MVRVAGAVNAAIAAFGPTAAMRSPAIAMESATELGQRYARVFPEAYKEDFSATQGLADLRRLQSLSDSGELAVSFYLPEDAEPGERRFKLYLAGRSVDARSVLPGIAGLGRRLDPGDVHAVRGAWGGVITCDEREIEIVTPPAQLGSDAVRNVIGYSISGPAISTAM